VQRNTLVTISDNKIGTDANTDNTADFYEARVLSATDYYAFGMAMKERSFQSESYRYGFNGKENDTDWEVQDYGFRIYKPELGKFLSVDPLTPFAVELKRSFSTAFCLPISDWRKKLKASEIAKSMRNATICQTPCSAKYEFCVELSEATLRSFAFSQSLIGVRS
jgi:RHS repeat-associated protein